MNIETEIACLSVEIRNKEVGLQVFFLKNYSSPILNSFNVFLNLSQASIGSMYKS